ncbi:MAG TPA: carboxypeptidase regulatory-like domain-containing protein [Candidatus Elarobacter sp.]|nr:carboxypeptidase regulatory-like domain-containing protein [Candidatus Elarobacter sp.]
MINSFRKWILAVCLALLVSQGLLAQSDLGKISGFIKDPSGATIANAKVTIRNNTGIERQTTTNDSGYYVVTNVPPGLYTMIAEATGFQRYETSNNKLDPSADLVIDATLTVGTASQTVEVSASAVQLQTESAAVQKLVTREQIDSLELNGRNPIGLAALMPGARSGTLANLTFAFSQGPANFNGSRNPENLITYDGAPATRTRSNGTSLGAADVDSTQEVEILGTNYPAEYGRTSGAQIRIVTKTGTQDFHGAAYEYLKNDAFNANTWARNANALTGHVAPLKYNQFGYNLGGPFYIPGKFNTDKKKVFFYWGEEWVKYHFLESGSSVGSAGLLTVPTLKMRSGDFSELLDPNNPFVTRTVVNPADPTKTKIKVPVYVTDPQSPAASQCGQVISYGPPVVQNTNGCFAGNLIPSTRLSPNGIGILNAWPVPTQLTPATFIGGNGNWFAAKLHTFDQRKDTAGVDVNLTEKQRLRFHAMNYAYLEYQPLDGNTDRTPKFFNRPNKTGSLNHTWTLNPKMVNEVLISASEDVVLIPVDTANFFDRTKACAQSTVPCSLNYPYIFPTGKLLPNRIPTVNLSNFSGLSGGPYPSHSAGPIYDISDSFTWIKGNHTLKFGGLWERSGENDNDEINVQACPTCTNNQNGQFLFTDGRAGGTGVAVANAALGLFDTYSEIGHRAYTIFRANMWESFAQDSWKTRQNLTLTFGLRYSIIVPYHALWGNMIVFDPRFYDSSKAVTVSPTTGLIQGTVDPKTGLIAGTGADTLNGMVIPGSGFPSSAIKHFPEADASQFDFSRLFRGVSDHYSDIQWGEIQPRLGIAYQLNKRTVFRVGAGRYTTRLGVSDSIFLGGNPPFQPNASISNGLADNPGAGGGANVPLVVTTQSKAFKPPESWAWNVTYEREMFWKSLVSVGYVARRGVHLQREADINQPTTAVVAANPCLLPGAANPCKRDAFRPYQGFGSIRQTDNVANSMYNALQVAWNRRYSGGLQFGVSYTLSKSMDNGSNQRDVVPDTYDISMLWGPSEFDARHILVFNYLYDLPFFKNHSTLGGKLLGGWQISGVTQFQTGLPCSVAGPTDYTGVGLDSNFGCGQNGQYWVVSGTPKIIGTFGANGQWFDTSVFTIPATGTFNTQRVRNLVYQPGFQNWNLGLFKSFPITEKTGLQFRAEAYNFINHPNWCGGSGCSGTTNIGLNPTSLSTFGKVLTKGGGVGGGERNLQLSLRAYF